MRKSTFILTALLFFTFIPAAAFPQGAYWKHKVDQFRMLPNPKGEICFLGDSITDGCNWTELIQNLKVTNRGISGDTAQGVLDRIDEVTAGKPAKIFLMIGTNDLAWGGKTVPETRDKIGEIIDTVKRQSPSSQVYLESVLPVIDGMIKLYENKNINPLNGELEKLAAKKKATWINLAPLFRDGTGQLKKEFTEDGLHLNGKAYALWYGEIKKYLK
jgi:lysophospholipase L1-like esterase